MKKSKFTLPVTAKVTPLSKTSKWARVNTKDWREGGGGVLRICLVNFHFVFVTDLLLEYLLLQISMAIICFTCSFMYFCCCSLQLSLYWIHMHMVLFPMIVMAYMYFLFKRLLNVAPQLWSLATFCWLGMRESMHETVFLLQRYQENILHMMIQVCLSCK